MLSVGYRIGRAHCGRGGVGAGCGGGLSGAHCPVGRQLCVVHHGNGGAGAGRCAPGRRRNRRRPAPGAFAWRPGGRQGSVRHRGNPDYERIDYSGRKRSRRRCHGYGPSPRGRNGAAGQAEYERVCQRRRFPASLWPAAQSVGHGAQSWHVQQRLRGGYGGVSMRHRAGRGHRRQHPGAGGILRAGGHPAHLWPSEPARGVRRLLVNGHGGPYFPHGHRLRSHSGGHCRA